MCTAVTFQTKDFYFGRTLDYEHSFQEQLLLTPRGYPLIFRHCGLPAKRYAILGMGCIADGYPLYFDAFNEKGLAMAGLNFVGFAHYETPADGKDNIAQFELIPWILSQCENISQAKTLLERIRITGDDFRADIPSAQLHWLIADKGGALTVEATKEGLCIHENAVGVLTNNPPFEAQMLHLANYMELSPKVPENRFAPDLSLPVISRGMGAMGLPGDLSSQSRFVRAVFAKLNGISGESEAESVNQFFHMLGTVEQTRGCCEVREGEYEITQYTSCCNASRGIYYYTTYGNHQITGVDMRGENLDGDSLICYPLVRGEQIRMENGSPAEVSLPGQDIRSASAK